MKARIRAGRILVTAVLAVAASARAETSPDYESMTLEQLMDVDVTSVSKHSQGASKAPAAIYVITSQDIQRSTARTIPDLLRIVPGIEVQQLDNTRWQIASRGLNGLFTDKMLVLIDGRSVYTPLFAGVFWDLQDTILEDVDRIEVIRGPGAALWGSNAVNGVINIVTKSSKETQGGLVSGGSGTIERGFGQARYGGTVGDATTYRIYSKYFSRENLREHSMGHREAEDDAQYARAGFRIDSEATTSDKFTVSADVVKGNSGSQVSPPVVPPAAPIEGESKDNTYEYNVLGRWSHASSERSQWETQMYFDRVKKDVAAFKFYTNTADLQTEHSWRVADWFNLVSGGGYRLILDDLGSSELLGLSFSDEHRSTDLSNLFVHSEFTLFPERLVLTLGLKYEYNSYTQNEYQPNARLALTAAPGHTLWASAARAVAIPSRAEDDVRFRSDFLGVDQQTGLPIRANFTGNKDLQADNLHAFEFGYRGVLDDWVTLDIATFYNYYYDISTSEAVSIGPSPDGTPSLLLEGTGGNKLGGHSLGGEAVLNFQLSDSSRAQVSYSYLNVDLVRDSTNRTITSINSSAYDPRHQVKLHLANDLPWGIQLDNFFYFVSAIERTSSYRRLDTKVGYPLTKSLTASVSVLNILQRYHRETPNSNFGNFVANEIPRSVYGSLEWKF